MKLSVCVLPFVGSLVFARSLQWRSSSQSMIQDIPAGNKSLPSLTIGIIVPHTNFGAREYTKAINRAVGGLYRGRGQPKLSFLSKYRFTQYDITSVMMKLTPSPTGNLFLSITKLKIKLVN